jgi:hypothetical protein
VALLARELGVSPGPGECEEIVQLLVAARTTALARRLAAALTTRREHHFAFSLAPEEPLLTGVLDLLVRDPSGGYLVVDYKSDRVAPEEDLETVVRRDYGAQRLVYALAALHDGASQVEVVHWFLARPEEWVSATFARAELPALERQLLDRARRVRAAGFAVSPAPHRALCLTCPGRATLCSWGDSQTLRRLPSSEAA